MTGTALVSKLINCCTNNVHIGLLFIFILNFFKRVQYMNDCLEVVSESGEMGVEMP